MRGFTRLLMGAAVGLLVGMGVSRSTGLRPGDWWVPALTLAPLGSLLVLVFRLSREQGARAALAGVVAAGLGSALAGALLDNWLEPIGLIGSADLPSLGYPLAAAGALAGAAAYLALAVSALVMLTLVLMLASGNSLVAGLGLLILIFVSTRRGR